MLNYYNQSSAEVKLDSYICDLNLDISTDGYSCTPVSNDGFCHMWAGTKANFGIRSGKVCYEIKVAEYNEVADDTQNDIHSVRVGWSSEKAILQLGEDENSFGFGSAGYVSHKRNFSSYGIKFGKGDVVGCYLAIQSGWLSISYKMNKCYLGDAFKMRWVSDEALFPHILTKNCKVEVNFGQAQFPYFPIEPPYKLVGHIPRQALIPSIRRPPTQADCEIIMLVGLPGVGKTTWANEFAKNHSSKKYFVLGTDSVIDKMRIMGKPRQNNFTGQWEILIKQATDCFTKQLKKAALKPRNLILDQTNVYAVARERKVAQYRQRGYKQIKCMVLVPTDEEMIRRSIARTRENGKNVPLAAMLDMKANFTLPQENEGLFDSITFLELQREDAQRLVTQYNNEAYQKGHVANIYRSIKQSTTDKRSSETQQSQSSLPNKTFANRNQLSTPYQIKPSSHNLVDKQDPNFRGVRKMLNANEEAYNREGVAKRFETSNQTNDEYSYGHNYNNESKVENTSYAEYNQNSRNESWSSWNYPENKINQHPDQMQQARYQQPRLNDPQTSGQRYNAPYEEPAERNWRQPIEHRQTNYPHPDNRSMNQTSEYWHKPEETRSNQFHQKDFSEHNVEYSDAQNHSNPEFLRPMYPESDRAIERKPFFQPPFPRSFPNRAPEPHCKDPSNYDSEPNTGYDHQPFNQSGFHEANKFPDAPYEDIRSNIRDRYDEMKPPAKFESVGNCRIPHQDQMSSARASNRSNQSRNPAIKNFTSDTFNRRNHEEEDWRSNNCEYNSRIPESERRARRGRSRERLRRFPSRQRSKSKSLSPRRRTRSLRYSSERSTRRLPRSRSPRSSRTYKERTDRYSSSRSSGVKTEVQPPSGDKSCQEETDGFRSSQLVKGYSRSENDPRKSSLDISSNQSLPNTEMRSTANQQPRNYSNVEQEFGMRNSFPQDNSNSEPPYRATNNNLNVETAEANRTNPASNASENISVNNRLTEDPQHVHNIPNERNMQLAFHNDGQQMLRPQFTGSDHMNHQQKMARPGFGPPQTYVRSRPPTGFRMPNEARPSHGRKILLATPGSNVPNMASSYEDNSQYGEEGFEQQEYYEPETHWDESGYMEHNQMNGAPRFHSNFQQRAPMMRPRKPMIRNMNPRLMLPRHPIRHPRMRPSGLRMGLRPHRPGFMRPRRPIMRPHMM